MARKFERHVYVVTCQTIEMGDWAHEFKVSTEVEYVFDDRAKANAYVAYAEKEFANPELIEKYFVREVSLNPHYEGVTD